MRFLNNIIVVFLSTISLGIAELYPEPCPINKEIPSFNHNHNNTKPLPIPTTQSSLPVIDNQFIRNDVKPNVQEINNYKPKTLLHNFFIENI